MVGFVGLVFPVVEVFEQPTAVIAATERSTASRAPQRRRRGTVSRTMQARVAPEPAMYQGVWPEGGWLEWGLADDAVVEVVKAWTTKEVATPAELMVTGETENEVVALAESLLVAVRVTAPVNPLTGLIVKVTPGAVAPGKTVVVPTQGVIEKSGFVADTISTEARDPLGKPPVGSGASSVPLEPALTASPE